MPGMLLPGILCDYTSEAAMTKAKRDLQNGGADPLDQHLPQQRKSLLVVLLQDSIGVIVTVKSPACYDAP
jgi:hypothetical protein